MVNHFRSLNKKYDLSNHELTRFHMKDLLQEKIEVTFERNVYFTVECCVCGYHFLKSFWETPVGSILIAKHEVVRQSLIHDKFAIALVNGDWVTVGHNPKFYVQTDILFLQT